MRGFIYFWNEADRISPGCSLELDDAESFRDAIENGVRTAQNHQKDGPLLPESCAAALCYQQFPHVMMVNAPGGPSMGSVISQMQRPDYGPIAPERQIEHFGFALVNVRTDEFITEIWNGRGFDRPDACNVHIVRKVPILEMGLS